MISAKKRLGFSMVELMVSIGVSTVVALGTGAAIIRGAGLQAKVLSKNEESSVAKELRAMLTGYQTIARASGMTGAAALAGACPGNMSISFSNLYFPPNGTGIPVYPTTKAILAAGQSIQICLTIGPGKIADGKDATGNQIYLGGAKRVKILSLDFGNAALAASDTNQHLDTWTGDLYLNYAPADNAIVSQVSTTQAESNVQKIFIGRTVLPIWTDLAAVDVTKCSAPNVISCNAGVSALPPPSKILCSGDSDQMAQGSNGACQRMPIDGSILNSTLTICPAGFILITYDANQNAICQASPAELCNGSQAAMGFEALAPVCSTQTPFLNSAGPAPPPAGACMIGAGTTWVDGATLLTCVADYTILVLDGNTGTAIDSMSPPNAGSSQFSCAAGVPTTVNPICHPTGAAASAGGCTVTAGTTWTDPGGTLTCASDAAIVIQNGGKGVLADNTSGANRGYVTYVCTNTVASQDASKQAACGNSAAAVGLTGGGANDPSCAAYMLALVSCQHMNAVTSAAGSAVACTLPVISTTATCGTSIVSTPPAPITNLAPQPNQGPSVSTCQCGATPIRPGQYCGFCSVTQDLGYGGGATSTNMYSRVEVCLAGGLSYVANGQLTPPTDPLKCKNGLRQPLNCNTAASPITCATY